MRLRYGFFWLCTVLTVLVLLFVPISAAEAGVCGDNATWTYDADSGTLTVTGTGAMWDMAADFFDPIERIRQMAYEKTLARQPEEAHTVPWGEVRGDIRSVVIGEGITTVGNYAFQGCGRLTAVTLPSTLLSIGDGAFLHSYEIYEIDLPDALQSIGDFALYSANLSAVHIPRELREIGPFSLCGDGVMDVGYHLAAITVDPENAYFCAEDNVLFTKDRTELVLFPVFGESTVYTLPDTVQRIRDYAAVNLSATEFHMGEGLREIGVGSFSSACCPSLRIPASVEKIGAYAFTGGYSLKWIEVDPANPYFKSIDGVLYTKDGTEVLACPPRKWGYLCLPETVEIIRGGAFHESSLNELRFTGDRLTEIEREGIVHCQYLRALWFPASLKRMEEGAVQSNAGLRELYFAGDAPEVYPSEGKEYAANAAIAAYDMPATLYYLSGQKGWDTFEGVWLIPTPVEEIVERPIPSCGSGAVWWYSENETTGGELHIRGEGAVYDYTDTAVPWSDWSDQIHVVYFQEDITKIGDNVLRDLPNVREVCFLHDAVVEIGSGNFCDMPSLTAVEIPARVAKIGSGCFENVPALTALTVDGDNTHYRVENGVLVCLDPETDAETETMTEEKGAPAEDTAAEEKDAAASKRHAVWYGIGAACLCGIAAVAVIWRKRAGR